MPKRNQNNQPIQVPEELEIGTEFNTSEVKRDQQKHKVRRHVTLDPREDQFKRNKK